jgi:hypothetical protein
MRSSTGMFHIGELGLCLYEDCRAGYLVRDGEKTRAVELIFACIITPHIALVGQAKAGPFDVSIFR